MRLIIRKEFLILKEGKFYIKRIIRTKKPPIVRFLNVTDEIKKTIKLL